MLMQAFAPLYALSSGVGNLTNAIVVSTSTTPATASLRSAGVGSGAGNQQCVQVCNLASAWLWLNFGNAGLTAAAIPVSSNIPIIGVPPNAVVVYTIDFSVTTVAYVIGSGTGVGVFNLGEGV